MDSALNQCEFDLPDTLPFDIQGITYSNFGYWSQNMLPWDVAHEVKWATCYFCQTITGFFLAVTTLAT
jgi:hypothetical protein